jgi:hypothetical protein
VICFLYRNTHKDIRLLCNRGLIRSKDADINSLSLSIFYDYFSFSSYFLSNECDGLSFISLQKPSHRLWFGGLCLHEKHYHVIMRNATTNINESNVTDIRSNGSIAPSTMNMNSSSMSSMLERGNIAMGFNQSKILHHFVATPTGGEIIIVALNSSDVKTINQIKNHVIEIQKDFSEGNFTKPFFIHAQVVPGTKIMTEKKDLIDYSVQQIRNGYMLVLTTSDRELIAAIKQFMVFQASQHSGH